jgi:hypothetical protein
MLCREISEHHAHPDLRAGSWVLAAEYTVHVIAAGIQPLYRLLRVVEHLGVGVGP